MLNLLTVDTTDLVVTLSVVAILLAFLLMLIFGKRKSTLTTKKITVIALGVSLTTTLSFLKFSLPFGGSITLFSLVPVILVSYYYGVYLGLLTGLITGLLQFITSPYLLTPLTFFLDYAFAFSCICFAGAYKKIIKNKSASLIVGASTFYFSRYVMHFLSGMIYFSFGYVYEGFPSSNAIIYSLCYNAVYLVPDFIISLIFLIVFSRTKVFKNDMLI